MFEIKEIFYNNVYCKKVEEFKLCNHDCNDCENSLIKIHETKTGSNSVS